MIFLKKYCLLQLTVTAFTMPFPWFWRSTPAAAPAPAPAAPARATRNETPSSFSFNATGRAADLFAESFRCCGKRETRHRHAEHGHAEGDILPYVWTDQIQREVGDEELLEQVLSKMIVALDGGTIIILHDGSAPFIYKIGNMFSTRMMIFEIPTEETDAAQMVTEINDLLKKIPLGSRMTKLFVLVAGRDETTTTQITKSLADLTKAKCVNFIHTG